MLLSHTLLQGRITTKKIQQPRVRFPAFPKRFQRKIIDVAKVYQRRWLEESGQWLENVDPTHLVLASGKPELQKNRK